MKRAIITVATRAGNYINNLARLSESLRNNFDGDILGFIGEASVGSPLHEDVPYGFKVYAFQKAKEAGYESVLWVDTSCFAIKNVSPVFEQIEETGFIFQDAGHFLGTWASDKQLKYFGLTRDKAMDMRMIGNAGFLGLNLTRSTPLYFLQQWQQAMYDGMFNGKWNNDEKTESNDERCLGSRHDMVCSSALIHNMVLFDLAKSGSEWLQYAGPYDEVANETIIFKAQG